MLCMDQYFHNPHFRRVRQGMKQYIYGIKQMICRATGLTAEYPATYLHVVE